MQTNKEPILKSRKKLYIEIMRILAMVFVIYNHTGEMGYSHFSQCEPGSIPFWFSLFTAVFCKFAVSLFFMISGALMLNRPQESLKITFKKRILRYLLILTAISLFYAVFHHILYGNTYTIGSFLKMLYASNVKYHLGFLYAYIAYLIMLPLLKAFCQGMENRHFVYLMLVYFCIQLLPPLQYFLWKGSFSLNSNIYPGLPGYALVIPMAGYFFEHRVSLDSIRKSLWIVWLINLFCIALSCWATYIRGMDSGVFSEGSSQTYFQNFSWVGAITVYLTVKALTADIRWSQPAQKGILAVSRTSLDIYLFHPMVKNLLDLHVLGWIQSLNVRAVFKGWIYVFFIFLGSFLFSLAFQKVTALLTSVLHKKRSQAA